MFSDGPKVEQEKCFFAEPVNMFRRLLPALWTSAVLMPFPVSFCLARSTIARTLLVASAGLATQLLPWSIPLPAAPPPASPPAAAAAVLASFIRILRALIVSRSSVSSMLSAVLSTSVAVLVRVQQAPIEQRVVHERLEDGHQAVLVVPEDMHDAFAASPIGAHDSGDLHRVDQHPGQTEGDLPGELFALHCDLDITTNMFRRLLPALWTLLFEDSRCPVNRNPDTTEYFRRIHFLQNIFQ